MTTPIHRKMIRAAAAEGLLLSITADGEQLSKPSDSVAAHLAASELAEECCVRVLRPVMGPPREGKVRPMPQNLGYLYVIPGSGMHPEETIADFGVPAELWERKEENWIDRTWDRLLREQYS